MIERKRISQRESNERFQTALGLMRKYGQLTVFQLMKALDTPYNDAQMLLKMLCKQRIADPLGKLETVEAVIMPAVGPSGFSIPLKNAMDICLELLSQADEVENFKRGLVEKRKEPYLLFFEMQGEFYDVLYIPSGRASYFNEYFKRIETEVAVDGKMIDISSKYIVIYEDASESIDYTYPNTVAKYKTTANGELAYVEN